MRADRRGTWLLPARLHSARLGVGTLLVTIACLQCGSGCTSENAMMGPAPINSGEDVPDGMFRDCVAIANSAGKYYASGVLIAPDLVLTAGHLLKEEPAKILIGEEVRDPDRDEIKVVRAIRHPGYLEQDPGVPPSRPSFVNDIAVLVLERDVTPPEAEPARLASADQIDHAGTVRIVGFGGDGRSALPEWGLGIKRYGDVEVETCDCEKLVDGRASQVVYGCLKGMELVAKDNRPKVRIQDRIDSAAGDSGGPLYVRDGEGWRLAGVISRPTFLTQEAHREIRQALMAGDQAPLALLTGVGGIYVRLDRQAEFLAAAAREARAWRRDPGGPRPKEKAAGSNARSIWDDPAFQSNFDVQLVERFARGGRIYNGSTLGVTDLPRGQFRECVAVGDEGGKYFGSGVLIAPELVLTAGHLLDRRPAKILIGEDIQDPKRIEIGVDRAIRHPDFGEPAAGDAEGGPSIVNDLAVLVLKRKVLANEARPARFASSDLINGAKSVWIVGFGPNGDQTLPDWGFGTKRYGEVSVATCNCEGEVDGVTREQAYGCIRGKELVALDLRSKVPIQDRVDSADGDSGGPLYVRDGDGWRVAAVISRAVHLTDKAKKEVVAAVRQGHNGPIRLRTGIGGIYIRVDRYSEFLAMADREVQAGRRDPPGPGGGNRPAGP